VTGVTGASGVTGSTGSTAPVGTVPTITDRRRQSCSARISRLASSTPDRCSSRRRRRDRSLRAADDGGDGQRRRALGTLATPRLLVPGRTAEVVHGVAAAPENAPAAVRRIIWAANQIIGRPYVFGGGHRSFSSNG